MATRGDREREFYRCRKRKDEKEGSGVENVFVEMFSFGKEKNKDGKDIEKM